MLYLGQSVVLLIGAMNKMISKSEVEQRKKEKEEAFSRLTPYEKQIEGMKQVNLSFLRG